MRLLVTQDTTPLVQRCRKRNHFPFAEHKSHRHSFYLQFWQLPIYSPVLLVPAPGEASLTGELESHKLLFDKYYLLAGRECGGKFTSKKVSLHATSTYNDWRTCKQNLQTFSRRYDSRCISRTWRDANSSWTKQTVQLKKKKREKSWPICALALISLRKLQN